MSTEGWCWWFGGASRYGSLITARFGHILTYSRTDRVEKLE